MGTHSLPRSSRTDVGRIAGVGVLAALSLAGGAGVASAHGTGSGDDDGGDGARTVSRADDTASTTTDQDGLCAVLGDVDLPGLDCASDVSTTGDDVRPTSTTTSGSDDTSVAPGDAATRGTAAPSSAPDTSGAQRTSATPNRTQDTGGTGTADRSTASPSPAQPKTTGNPVDAPAKPGTTRTLPIGG